jgi:hypothetical protein
LEPAFSIVANEAVGDNRILMAEVAPWGVSYAIADTSRMIQALYVFHFPSDATADKTALFIKQSVAAIPALQGEFSRVTIVYQYPEAILVPQIYLQQQYTRELLELTAGNITDAAIQKDYVQKEQLYVIFAIPRVQESVVNYVFQADRVTHGYAQLLQYPALQSGSSLHCIFGNNAFLLHLVKDGKLCLLQHYPFKAPEDVAYLLLKACETHQLSTNDILVLVSGMITDESAVYACLLKYFLHIQFSALPDGCVYPAEIKEYPAHYFSHIFQMLLCEL